MIDVSADKWSEIEMKLKEKKNNVTNSTGRKLGLATIRPDDTQPGRSRITMHCSRSRTDTPTSARVTRCDFLEHLARRTRAQLCDFICWNRENNFGGRSSHRFISWTHALIPTQLPYTRMTREIDYGPLSWIIILENFWKCVANLILDRDTSWKTIQNVPEGWDLAFRFQRWRRTS